MSTIAGAAAFAGVVLGAGGVRSSQACSLLAPVDHEIDLREVGVDVTAPSIPGPVSVSVRDFDDDDGCDSDSCSDLIAITLTVTPATDDRSTEAVIGYRVVLTRGRLPDGLHLPTDPKRLTDGALFFGWIDQEDDIDFFIDVIAVDSAGNEGPPRSVHVSDGSLGCAAARGGTHAWWTGLALLVLLLRARLRSPSAAVEFND